MNHIEDQARRKDDARADDKLHWDDGCSICAGTGTTFGKECVCMIGAADGPATIAHDLGEFPPALDAARKAQIIALANASGIDTDTDGDIWGSTNGALLKFADALIDGDLAAPTLASAPQAERAAVPEGFVLMPNRLTAENGAKSLFMGEFKEQIEVPCPDCHDEGEDYACPTCENVGTVLQDISVGWDTIKRIYDMAVKHLAAPVAQEGEQSARLVEPDECAANMNGHQFERVVHDGLEHCRWCGASPSSTEASAQAEQPTVDARNEAEISRELMEVARGTSDDYLRGLLERAANEANRFYGGMMAWKQTAQKKDRDWNEERMARENERCAQRAAASSESVDTPEFRKLLSSYVSASMEISEAKKPRFARLIAHIESLIAARVAGVRKDAERLDAIAHNYWSLDLFTTAYGEDIGWRVAAYREHETLPRAVAEVFRDDPRAAIDAAISAATASQKGEQA
jgi:hypothetical protein